MKKIEAIDPIWNHETEKLIPAGQTTEFRDEAAAQSLIDSGAAKLYEPEALPSHAPVDAEPQPFTEYVEHAREGKASA